MATKQARGTKRTCQNGECGARFYDLDRKPILCPVCGEKYELASSPLTASAILAEERASRSKKTEYVIVKAPVVAEAESDEAVAETEEGAAIETGDETFLEEEEEEGGDLSNVIGGPVQEGEEEV